MNNSVSTKIKRFLAFLLVACIFGSIAYLAIYKISFLPNGYDIASQQKNSIVVKSFSTLGFEDDITTLTFSVNDIWKIDDISYEVKRQKEFLWAFFTLFTTSIFLIIFKLYNGRKIWNAILESNIFASMVPLIPLIYSLNRIEYLIS